jgi:polyisoprenoid-binding protein YceI
MRLAPLILCLAFAPPALAQEPIPNGIVRQGTLSFDGKATMGDFTGTTQTVAGELTGGATLAQVRGWVEAPVATLLTGNGKRDRDLNKSMESEKYPTIRFELNDITAEAASGDSTPATLHGNLIIHGVSRAVDLPATLNLSPDSARVLTSFPLNLKDYQIGGLTKMLGMLKMHEDIVVHVDVVFEYRK